MSKDGLFTDGSENFAPRANAIPLSDVDTSKSGEASIGQLVSNASEQISSLVRSELELAKTELAAAAKKGGIGAGLFGAAGVVALYSSFFFFFFLAELLSHLWFDRWAAFLIVFLIMLVLAGVLALLGLKNVKKVKSPEKTIASAKELKNVIPGSKGSKELTNPQSGLYT
ncbi:phage holin family protein [Corynebacterium lizhenjunii]|uniref:Phage holin family protein n=1 Tax=Corynebacterium lizhenjunii TaxID=2709394 RepID=A0A7T0KEV6_9CORY|nr:phage holin family protein [Corynebacterium lizhenjunii]QPK79342.1 phage holin family protein [Corynebacterium lizhenjunii]